MDAKQANELKLEYILEKIERESKYYGKSAIAIREPLSKKDIEFFQNKGFIISEQLVYEWRGCFPPKRYEIQEFVIRW